MTRAPGFRASAPTPAAPENAVLLRVEALSKHFPIRRGLLQRVVGAVRALDDVGFEVRAGEVFGLAGESGSGKSTLARILVGLSLPTSGRVSIDGVDVSRERDRRALGKRVQMVFQNPGSSLNPRRSIAQTLRLPLVIEGVPSLTRALSEHPLASTSGVWKEATSPRRVSRSTGLVCVFRGRARPRKSSSIRERRASSSLTMRVRPSSFSRTSSSSRRRAARVISSS